MSIVRRRSPRRERLDSTGRRYARAECGTESSIFVVQILVLLPNGRGRNLVLSGRSEKRGEMSIVASVESMQGLAPVSHDSRRPRVLAYFLPLAAALLMVGEALTPKGLDKPSTTLAGALKAVTIGAAHPGQAYVSNLLVIFGLGALGVSFAAIASLTRGRGATIGVVAAVIGGIAAFCGAVSNLLVGFNVAAAATADVPSNAAARVLASADSSTAAVALVATYLIGGLLAVILTATALWRSHTVPRWLPILFGIGLVLAATSRPGITAVPTQLPFAAAMFVLAARISRYDRSES